jgi:hypothetical protein
MASQPSKPDTKIKSADPKPAPAPIKVRSRMQRTALIRNIHTK